MAEVLLFHHVHGLTDGCLAFADQLRAAGHTVHTPDLFDGRTFATLDEGLDHAGHIGFETIVERGRDVADALPPGLIYGGWSLGAMPAQALAQTRPGARAAVLLHSAIPVTEFGGSWPDGLPLQIHTREADPLGDAGVARELAATIDSCELYLYPGDQHLFTDASLPVYDEAATALVVDRLLGLLRGLG
jgi:dienelactone hydrolase